MGKRLQLTGLQFGRLLVQNYAGLDKSQNSVWLCLCDCGETIITQGCGLQSGNTKSCGCLARELSSKRNSTHGHKKNYKRSPTYHSWLAMRERCYRKKHPRYKDYGGRGISVCRRWKNSFSNFLSDMGERPARKTLDRKNTNGNYTPSNCRWSTPTSQALNRRNSKRNRFPRRSTQTPNALAKKQPAWG